MTHYLWKLRPYLRQVAGQLVLGALAGVVANTMAVLPAVMLGHAVDVALAFEKGKANREDVGWAALWYLAAMLLNQVPRIAKRWFLTTANARIRANLRADALRGVLSWPMERLHGITVGDLMARMVSDIEVLGASIREVTVEAWDTLLLCAALIAMLFWYDPWLSVVAMLPMPVAMLLAFATGRWVRRRTAAAREANAGLTSMLQEQLAGIRVLKLFGRTGEAAGRVERQSESVVAANLSVTRLREGLKPVYSITMVAGVLLVVALGGQRVVAGALTVGAFVAYMELFLRFTGRGERIPRLLNGIQAGGVAYARLEPLLAPPQSRRGEPPYASFRAGRVCGVDEPLPSEVRLESKPLGLTFSGVTFRYPGATAPALTGISLDIPAGSFVAITGRVGCGKSALLRAALGLYPLEQGVIRLDGRELAEIPEPERLAQTGYLPQDPHLFSGSVRENITFGAPSDAQNGRAARLEAATRIAVLSADLTTLPAGLETQIGELGIRVSGGQRQRVALARSLVAPPSLPGLLLLDDPFSAVDVDTEAQLITALREAFGPAASAGQRATIVLCSHRLASFPQADRVVVLGEGRVVESGTHAELMNAGGTYEHIFKAQAVVLRAGENGARA
jgi:ATP-binding cassette, subfamily B, multidrug efflux pump